MIIPESLTFYGTKWKIYNGKGIPKRLRKTCNLKEGVLGYTDFSTYTICLAEGLSQEEQEETLIHELLHACYHLSGDELLSPALEERVIESLDKVLYKAIKALLEVQVNGKVSS